MSLRRHLLTKKAPPAAFDTPATELQTQNTGQELSELPPYHLLSFDICDKAMKSPAKTYGRALLIRRDLRYWVLQDCSQRRQTARIRRRLGRGRSRFNIP